MMQRKLSFVSLALLMIAALLLSAVPPIALAEPAAPDATYGPYTTAPAGDITDTGTIPDNACGDTGWPNTRYFLVNDHFTVTDLNVRFVASHNERGNIRVILTSPPDATGARVQQTIVATSGDGDDNYDILLDADGSGALDDNSADNTADPVDRTVQQTLLNSYEGRDARGAWRMDICDNNDGTTGTLVGAALYFTGDPITVTPPTFTQGPAVLETYYIPLPESEMWAAMGTLFYPSRAAASGDTSVQEACLNYSSVNANPRQPMIGYTGVTIAEDSTIIYYDHWEDGYEAVINFPTQNTTEVWGDGILTNGRAPGDADDVLAAGQIVILNDVKDSTAAEVVDYDAKDKLASTAAVAVSRSLWSNGSTTLFAAADEVYPTSMWGADYRVPVGETTDTLYDYFQYTGVSVMASADGTNIYIDRNNDGTPEKSCLNLPQGGTCQWDDKSDSSGIMGVNNVIGNGLIAGSRITSNNKVQVTLLTGDVCAGYETRSYTLLPTTAWSNQYYAPVSSNAAGRTITPVGGQTTTSYDPAVVHLYNPGSSPLTVNWTFGTGATGSQSIGANAFHTVQIPDTSPSDQDSGGTGARFYSTGTFYAVSTVDANGGNNGSDRDGGAADWGYTLVPVTSMSQYIIVGWAPGADPNIPNSTEDSAPIWLTGGHTINPASTTAFTVCIDEGGNGGTNTDPITGRTYDRTISVTPFGQSIVYDNRTGVYGETGMQLWVCDATNGSDAVITAAWGEDPDTISVYGKPTMDMGYTMRNLRNWDTTKGVELLIDEDGNGLYDEGDTVRFEITVRNRGSAITANTLTVTDVLPAGVTYVPGSTIVYDDGGNPDPIADGTATPFPLDEGGYTYDQALPAGKSFLITFEAEIGAGAGGVDGNTLCNVEATNDGSLTQEGEACFFVQARGVIGNYVWVDENSDGYQDAGEPGIPNVTVNLYNRNGVLVATTVTDAQGGYLFDSLPAGTYYVDVVEATLPAGMTQTPYNLPGSDFGNQDHSTTTIPTTALTGYPVTIGGAYPNDNLTADFGYNYNPTSDVDDGTGVATIGDRVWVDADGDGVQDPEEVGIQGVTVQLTTAGTDGLFGTGDDVVVGTDVTDANGNYLFDGLPAGAYVVTVTTPPGGYTQTGDPDHFAASGGVNDNKTTTPILLGPGDVFLNADFGYQPPASQNNSIGNKVWFDADADGVGPGGNGAAPATDNNETGIAGVTVALIKDGNGNGIWDLGEPIIATDTTDANGEYLFAGLPDGNYLVWVNDTDIILGGKTPTYDADAGTAQAIIGAPIGVASSTVLGLSASALDPTGTDSNPVSDLTQDFGYTAARQTPELGLIGDRVWLDIDADGVQDAGEPALEGIRVTLLDTAGNELATTTTDENGNYYFGGLPAGTYTVEVAPPSGLSQTYDADDGLTPFTSPNQSTVTIGAGGINLDQDFGYRGLGEIGNLVWEDLDADGVKDSTETGIGGVTLDLYLDKNGNGKVDPGDTLVGSTVTAADGSYLFSGLPTDDGGGNAQYVVDVTDEAGILGGWWHSLGEAGLNNNSQTDPYAVTLTPAAPSNLTADFGYYVKPAALGNRVWLDSATGTPYVQDPSDTGIPGVEVVLTITWPDGSTTVLKTITDAGGYYSFGNLLQDEDYAASTTGNPVTDGKPKFVVSVDWQKVKDEKGHWPTEENHGNDDAIDADAYAGVAGVVSQGQLDTTIVSGNPGSESAENAWCDFGFQAAPLAVNLSSFAAEATVEGVTLAWEMVSEIDNAGFNIYRAESASGPWTQINATLIPAAAPGASQAQVYTWLDDTVLAGMTYWYVLEDVALSGATTRHEPLEVTVAAPTAVSMTGFGAAAVAAWPALAGLTALLGVAAAGYARRRRSD